MALFAERGARPVPVPGCGGDPSARWVRTRRRGTGSAVSRRRGSVGSGASGSRSSGRWAPKERRRQDTAGDPASDDANPGTPRAEPPTCRAPPPRKALRVAPFAERGAGPVPVPVPGLPAETRLAPGSARGNTEPGAPSRDAPAASAPRGVGAAQGQVDGAGDDAHDAAGDPAVDEADPGNPGAERTTSGCRCARSGGADAVELAHPDDAGRPRGDAAGEPAGDEADPGTSGAEPLICPTPRPSRPIPFFETGERRVSAPTRPPGRAETSGVPAAAAGPGRSPERVRIPAPVALDALRPGRRPGRSPNPGRRGAAGPSGGPRCPNRGTPRCPRRSAPPEAAGSRGVSAPAGFVPDC